MAFGAILGAAYYTRSRGSLVIDAARMDKLASMIIRAAFWGVLLVGIADAMISFIRVEDLHTSMFGKDIATKLGLSSWRGMYIHIPLMILGAIIGFRDKSVSVIWLILLVVIAEMLIVLARFIFAYEQTFMGDLVRFWYAALFLFASAHTLKEEGHVRVDVIFASFKERTKAWVNATGSVAFGMPLCWLVLVLGMSGKSSLINSPMLNFETSMSGFGMYVKYLMAAFLVVFALSMLVQFTSYFLNALAIMNGDLSANDQAAEQKA
jgi:TRAP-type mannitol/chloroaromatic compound transport system permease small subunit